MREGEGEKEVERKEQGNEGQKGGRREGKGGGGKKEEEGLPSEKVGRGVLLCGMKRIG